jgi:Protein of unknown function (DUF2877)
MTRAVLIGAGAREALATRGAGRVLARFRRACYLDLPGGLVAVVPRSVHPGPVHLVVDELPDASGGMPVRVVVEGATLLVGERAVDLSAATPWLGRLPDPAAMVAAGPLLARAAARFAGRSALLSGRHRRQVGRFLGALRKGGLAAGAAELGGLGPGLTPAGDDALAAVLLHLRSTNPAGEATLRSVASSVPTGVVAGAFLAWAARGQALAPAHDLLWAAAGGEEGRALAAARELSRMGETSGADFCLGLFWAATAGAGSGGEPAVDRGVLLGAAPPGEPAGHLWAAAPEPAP